MTEDILLFAFLLSGFLVGLVALCSLMVSVNQKAKNQNTTQGD